MNARRLAQYAATVLGKPFVWGLTDCVSLVRFAILQSHGEDPWIGQDWYESQTGAYRLATKIGSAPVYLQQYGWTERPLADMQAGDVVIQPIITCERLPHFGIAISKGRYITSHESTGVCSRSMTEAVGAAYILRAADV
jgi:hypothetical protein